MATLNSILPAGGVRVALVATHSLTAGDSLLLSNDGGNDVYVSEVSTALATDAANPTAAHRLAPLGRAGIHGIQLTVPSGGEVYAWSPLGSGIVIG